ncbi:MAG: hypothetical protein NTY30_03595 [Candidatus Berkelbacteria bacterium]|nr:hypothetical protein [Candidatus Berkelbacteria bacterium]
MTADVAVALLISALIPVGGEPNYVPPVVAQMARAEARGMVDHNCREDSPIIRSAATGKNCREVRR